MEFAALTLISCICSHSFPGFKQHQGHGDCSGNFYGGIVKEIGKDFITIQLTFLKPRRFQVSDALARGIIANNQKPAGVDGQTYSVTPMEMYRLTDARLGDWVTIKFTHIENKHICDHIGIRKRPGGKMPPLPEEAEKLFQPKGRLTTLANFAGPNITIPAKAVPKSQYVPYNELVDAYWDFEDFGIPHPIPVYQGTITLTRFLQSLRCREIRENRQSL